MDQFEKVPGPKGWIIWTSLVDLNCESRCNALIVLSERRFYFGQFEDADEYRDALAQGQNGDEWDDEWSQHVKSIAFSRILRVEKPPGNQLNLKVKWNKSWKNGSIACPDDLGHELFQELRQRLKPRLRFDKEPISLFSAAMNPIVGVFVCTFFLGVLFIGSMITTTHHHKAVQNETSTSASFRIVGQLLGPKGVALLAVVVYLGLFAWIGVAWLVRPSQKVLRERIVD